jgi:hypothetical protein
VRLVRDWFLRGPQRAPYRTQTLRSLVERRLVCAYKDAEGKVWWGLTRAGVDAIASRGVSGAAYREALAKGVWDMPRIKPPIQCMRYKRARG